jgi:hypothetical protein
MNITEEYNKAKEEYDSAVDEFDIWFKAEIKKLLDDSIPDILIYDVQQLYNDLNAFVHLHHLYFRRSESKSNSSIDFFITHNHFGHGCHVNLQVDPFGRFNNNVVIDFSLSKRSLRAESAPELYSGLAHINVSDRINVVYNYLDFLSKHVDKFNALLGLKKHVSKLEIEVWHAEKDAKRKAQEEAEIKKAKQVRIRSLQTKSAEEWVLSLMKNSKYPYRIEKTKGRLILSVKINNKQQLEVPVHFNSFQKEIPFLMDTIKQFEEFIKERKISGVLVNKVSMSQYITWENDK